VSRAPSVAINTDESAQIFNFCQYGVVGDYRDVLKALNDEAGKILTRGGSSEGS
jgi:electron transfer flavoprotein alpha subunit